MKSIDLKKYVCFRLCVVVMLHFTEWVIIVKI